MPTATTIIKDALLEIGVLASGETPSAAMADDAFRALNRLMDILSNGQSFAFYPNKEIFNLTGQASFTIGPSGDLITDRPIRIETATIDRQGITYPVSVLDNQKWDAISYKGANGANTSGIFYEATMPNGIIHVWPIASGCTLNMRVINQVGVFPDLTTDLLLPPGYEEALIRNLAVSIFPQYPAGTLSPITLRAAKTSLTQINRVNNVIPTMQIDSVLLNYRGGSTLAGFLGGS